ncbi:hypothetical protein [Streptomyces sp. NPDC051211]|uniref:hypothetical protein n=1 Tax=Streptomyces sp. NPDC051211 TaxID=3154643 RepID=UPI00344C0A1A
MSALNTAKRIALGLVGALLAGGLLLAARAAPDSRAHGRHPGEVDVRHPRVAGDSVLTGTTPAGPGPWRRPAAR